MLGPAQPSSLESERTDLLLLQLEIEGLELGKQYNVSRSTQDFQLITVAVWLIEGVFTQKRGVLRILDKSQSGYQIMSVDGVPLPAQQYRSISFSIGPYIPMQASEAQVVSSMQQFNYYIENQNLVVNYMLSLSKYLLLLSYLISIYPLTLILLAGAQ